MSAAVHVHQATKYYGGPSVPVWGVKAPRSYSNLQQPLAALDRVSFHVAEGEIFGLCGPSSAGKTTLIRLLAARLQPDSGEVRVFGYDISRQRSQALRQTNRVSVDASFFKGLSPVDNLLRTTNPFAGDMRAEVADLLARLGLSVPNLVQPMEALSREQQQLVFIARAVLSRPRLLLLDEPTAGLDLIAQYRVREALTALRVAHGVTIVFTTREHRVAEALADRIALLSAGHLTAIEAPTATAAYPAIWSAQPDCVEPELSQCNF